jgi:hypothetical protein
MASKKKPAKLKLAVIQGGKVPPSSNSVAGVLQTALEKHSQQPYTDIFIVGVRSNAMPHVLNCDLMHHSKDRVRLLGVLTWAVERFMTLYLPPR